MCACTVCFVLAMQWGGVEKRWSNSNVIGCLVGFVILFLAFLVDQWWQGERALIPWVVFSNRTIYIGTIFSFFLGGAFFIHLFYLPIYFQAVKGTSVVSSGIHLIPMILSMSMYFLFLSFMASYFAAQMLTFSALTQIVGGVLITVTGIFNPWLICGSALTAIGSGLFMLLDIHTGARAWIGYQIVAGAGIGCCLAVPIIVAQRVIEHQNMGVATSTVICK